MKYAYPVCFVFVLLSLIGGSAYGQGSSFYVPSPPSPGEPTCNSYAPHVACNIFKVRASSCFIHNNTQNTDIKSQGVSSLTGVLLPEYEGILTALHGVVGCQELSAFNHENLTFAGLSMSKIDFNLDLALLTSAELSRHMQTSPYHGLQTSGNAIDFNTIKVMGYPLNIEQVTETRFIRINNITQLSNLIPSGENPAFAACASPSLSINVWQLEGTLRPGESGAPILNQHNQVIGIGMGGLKEGASEIVWASRTTDINLQPTQNFTSQLHTRAYQYCPTNRFSYGDGVSIVERTYLSRGSPDSLVPIYEDPMKNPMTLTRELGNIFQKLVTERGIPEELRYFQPTWTVPHGTEVIVLPQSDAVDVMEELRKSLVGEGSLTESLFTFFGAETEGTLLEHAMTTLVPNLADLNTLQLDSYDLRLVHVEIISGPLKGTKGWTPEHFIKKESLNVISVGDIH